MEQITTAADRDEFLKLSRRAKYEQERKERIFDAKQRIIGIDHHAIEAQIDASRRARELEKELDRRYTAQTTSMQNALHLEELRLERLARQQRKAIADFRALHQRFEQRREFELNDPCGKKKIPPLRLADHDTSLGPSSAQVFEGEDLYGKERRRMQQAQMSGWLDQQMAERKLSNDARKLADKAHADNLFLADLQLCTMSGGDRQNTRYRNENTAEINKRLAREKEAKCMRAKKEAAEDGLAEIYNWMTSDLLNKDKDKDRVVVEKQKLREQLLHQMHADQQPRHFTELSDTRFEISERHVDREISSKRQELKTMRKLKNIEVAQENLRLAAQRREDVVYKNEITPEFYKQFNKTSR